MPRWPSTSGVPRRGGGGRSRARGGPPPAPACGDSRGARGSSVPSASAASTAQPGSRSCRQSRNLQPAARSVTSEKVAPRPSAAPATPSERMPGVSIRSAPPGSRTSSRCVVVWRPRESSARTAFVRWRSGRGARSRAWTCRHPTSPAAPRCGPAPGARRQALDAVAGERRTRRTSTPGATALGRDPKAIDVGGQVGLVEHDDGSGAATPRDREVALDSPEVEVAVEARDDERDVHVRGEHLLAARRRPCCRPRRSCCAGMRCGGAGRPGSRRCRSPVGACRGDPVADRGQLAGTGRLVAEPAGDHRIPIAGRGRDHPRVAVRGHDPRRPPARRAERREGRRPALVPAERGEGGGDRDAESSSISRPA